MSREMARAVLRTEAEAILGLIDRLDERFDRAVELILEGRGRVVVSGMGKSGLIGKKIAATLASTGTPAFFIHPAEAVHGDIGMLVDGDIILALSNTGETGEILRLLEFTRRLSLEIIALVGRRDSTLAKHADVALDCGIAREACPLNLAPSASTTATLAMGDALALTLSQRRGFTPGDFARRHPGGQLGKRLLAVADLMSQGEDMPRLDSKAALSDAVVEMTRGGLGMTTLVDPSGRLVGIFTDGDLRRAIENGAALGAEAGRHATTAPKTIGRDEPASKALAIMEEYQITSLLVVDDDRRVSGVVHIHDLWRLEIF